MSQQINLFNPIFRKQGFSFTSATAIAYGLGIALIATAAVAAYEDHKLRTVQVQAQVVEQSFKDNTVRRDQLTAEVTQQKPNAQLDAEIANLDLQLKGRQEIIETLKSGVVGNTDGFSDYMRAFSRQSLIGLWLTGFDIALAGNALAIQGRALSADLVANYIKQLNQEQALQGRKFAAMRISQLPPEPVAPPTGEPGAKPADLKIQKDAKADKRPPGYVEFSVSTFDLPEPVARGETPPPPLLGAMLDAAKANVKREAGK